MAKLLTEEQYNELMARLERAERQVETAIYGLEIIAQLDFMEPAYNHRAEQAKSILRAMRNIKNG